MTINLNSILIVAAPLMLIFAWATGLGDGIDSRMATPLCIVIFCLFNGLLVKREYSSRVPVTIRTGPYRPR